MFYYVYIIQSIRFPEIIYVGYTLNVTQRLETHNSGGSVYTRKDRPWKLVTCVVFSDKHKATEFEKYLKSHSGRAFMKKRLC